MTKRQFIKKCSAAYPDDYLWHVYTHKSKGHCGDALAQYIVAVLEDSYADGDTDAERRDLAHVGVVKVIESLEDVLETLWK